MRNITVVYLTKYASFIAPARAGKYKKILENLSKRYECVVITPEEPFIDKDNISVTGVRYIWYYYLGYILRKIYYYLKRKGNSNLEKRKRKAERRIEVKGKVSYGIPIFKRLSSYIFPDAYLDTIPISFLITVALICKIKGNVVLVAGGYPYSNFFSGLLIKKLFGRKVRFVVEMRDPFANNSLNKGRGLVPRLKSFFEGRLFRAADEIWIYKGWFPSGISYFNEQYPLLLDKIVELPFSGFDKKIFNIDKKIKSIELEFLHAGNFYGGDYSPINFFKALSFVKSKGFVDFRVVFYGGLSEEYISIACSLGLEAHIQYNDYIPYEDIGAKLVHAQVLLWISGQEVSYKDNIPSKVFDYIGAEVPILALLPDGAGKKFAVENNIEFMAGTNDIAGIVECINIIIAQYKEGSLQSNKRDTHLYSDEYLSEVISNRIREISK